MIQVGIHEDATNVNMSTSTSQTETSDHLSCLLPNHLGLLQQMSFSVTIPFFSFFPNSAINIQVTYIFAIIEDPVLPLAYLKCEGRQLFFDSHEPTGRVHLVKGRGFYFILFFKNKNKDGSRTNPQGLQLPALVNRYTYIFEGGYEPIEK